MHNFFVTALSIDTAEPKNACAHIRQIGQFQQALHGAIFAESAVQQGKDDIDITVGARLRQDRLRMPLAGFINEVFDDFILGGVEAFLTDSAERTEISCSPERPPKIRARRIFWVGWVKNHCRARLPKNLLRGRCRDGATFVICGEKSVQSPHAAASVLYQSFYVPLPPPICPVVSHHSRTLRHIAFVERENSRRERSHRIGVIGAGGMATGHMKTLVADA